MRSRWLWITLSLGVVAGVWYGFHRVEERRCRLELERAKSEMAAGRFHPARRRLAELFKQRPDLVEATFQLGVCEENLGRLEAARAAWSAVPRMSGLSVKAILGQARVLF